MLTLEKQKAKLTSLNLRAEVHGDERVPAADIRFSFDAPNELLSEFDPALKSSFYRNPPLWRAQWGQKMSEHGLLSGRRVGVADRGATANQ
jgi:hypothetical protein